MSWAAYWFKADAIPWRACHSIGQSVSRRLQDKFPASVETMLSNSDLERWPTICASEFNPSSRQYSPFFSRRWIHRRCLSGNPYGRSESKWQIDSQCAAKFRRRAFESIGVTLCICQPRLMFLSASCWNSGLMGNSQGMILLILCKIRSYCNKGFLRYLSNLSIINSRFRSRTLVLKSQFRVGVQSR